MFGERSRRYHLRDGTQAVVMLAFDNTYARLPGKFFAAVSPTKVRTPRIIKVNEALAALLGASVADLTAEAMSGNVLLAGAEPIALAYAGHQFGGFVPQLGDGRAILLGEVVGTDGKRRDIQLKGSGRTPFSRGGDGRAGIGPVLREYVVSEAMAAMGIPTTRSLAAVTTGEPVMREEVLPGAILTRVAASHIRVGTFEFFAVRNDVEALRTLTTYALSRHYPDALGSSNDALALLDRVIEAQASLIARWLGVGFVHGVMNTDNTTLSGETIDYGPCAFLDEYDPNKKFSSIDRGRRYAFGNQPRIAQWNVARLAEALLPLIAGDEDEAVKVATEHLGRFPELFEAAYARVLRGKLGLMREEDSDVALAKRLHELLVGIDYTIFYRRLCSAAADPKTDLASLFEDRPAFAAWEQTWRARLAREAVAPDARADVMRRANPALIPRNHRVEEMIQAATKDDFAPFERLVRALEKPYDDQPEFSDLADPPRPDERVQETFCGT